MRHSRAVRKPPRQRSSAMRRPRTTTPTRSRWSSARSPRSSPKRRGDAMKYEKPDGTNPIDQLKVVGRGVDRIDGPLKTTGTAPYAHDRHDVVANQAYGYILGSAIAKGRIAAIDVAAAKAAPGVIAIVTAENAGKIGKGNFNTVKLLAGPEVQHYHQAVAVVVAETFEQARAAAHLVEVKYEKADGKFDLAAVKDTAKPADSFGTPGESKVGD